MADREFQTGTGSVRFQEMLQIASRAVALSLAADGVTRFYLEALLREDEQPVAGADAVMERFIAHLADYGILESALAASTRADDKLWESDIAGFLLNPLVAYSLHELAALWRLSMEDVLSIFRDDITEAYDRSYGIPRELMRVMSYDAMRAAVLFNVMPAYDVERALGRQFARVRPKEWRTRPVLLRLPQWLIERIMRKPMIPATADVAHRIETILMHYMEAAEY